MSEVITLNDGVGNSTYVQTSITKKEGLYRDDSSTLQNPRIARVSHESATSATGSDRHLVQLTRTDDDADGVPFTGSVHVVINAPREGVALADLNKEWVKLSTLITAKWSTIVGGFQPTD